MALHLNYLQISKSEVNIFKFQWFWGIYICFQRIVQMNKTEDDQTEGQELTPEELKMVAGGYNSL